MANVLEMMKYVQNGWADGQAEGKRNRFAQLSREAVTGDEATREAAIARAVGIDPTAGLALGDKIQGREDDMAKRAAGAAQYVLSQKDPVARAGAYRAVVPFLTKLGAASGKVPPAEYSPDMDPMMHEIVARAGGVGGAQGVHSGVIGQDGFVYNRMRDGTMVNTGVRADPKTALRDHPGMATTVVDLRAGTEAPLLGANGGPAAARPSEGQVAADQANARARVELATAPQIANATKRAELGATIDAIAPTAAANAAAASAYGTPESREAGASAEAKMPQLENVTRGLDRIDSALTALEKAPLSTGPIEQYATRFTEGGQELNAAVQGLQESMLSLTRVPGMGSQSDLEAKIAAAKYPQLGVDPAVNRRTMENLKAFEADLRAEMKRRVAKARGTQAAPSAPRAAPAGKQVKRTGTHNGRRVVQYTDGSMEYAD